MNDLREQLFSTCTIWRRVVTDTIAKKILFVHELSANSVSSVCKLHVIRMCIRKIRDQYGAAKGS